MIRKLLGMGATALLGLALIVPAFATTAGDDEPPTIKVIMAKLNKGPKALSGTIKKDLEKPTPDWKAIQEKTDEFATLSAALAKNDPPKGEKESWEKLTKGYAEHSKKLDDAAKKEDKKATEAALKTLSTSCKACHTAHKG